MTCDCTGKIRELEKKEKKSCAIYDPIQCKFVMDNHDDKERYSCVHGEYMDHDGTITINLAEMDELNLKRVITHEILHKVINETGIDTTEEQDHFIIPRLMS